MSFLRIIPFVHSLLTVRLSEGDFAIDATVGNGHDTSILANLVGDEGHVWGFDTQRQALDSANLRLKEMDLVHRVSLLHKGHEEMFDQIPRKAHGKIAAVTFNLGYLPGGRPQIVTRPETTIQALEQSLRILEKLGLVTVVVYRGHDGGMTEALRVVDWASRLPGGQFSVLSYEQINRTNPPGLIAIQKLI